MQPESEFLLNQLHQLGRPNRLARDELLFDESQHLSLKLMRTARTALLGYQPSHPALVEVGPGLIVGRTRHAVLLGGIGHGRVLDGGPASNNVDPSAAWQV